MHTSHDFIATKTCPSCEFLVVFGQVRVWDRKSAGRARVGMVCGAGTGWKCAGAGREWTKNFNPRRTLVASPNFFGRPKYLILCEQQYFLWNTASQSAKWLLTLTTWGAWPPKTRCFILCEKKHEWICSSASTLPQSCFHTFKKSVILGDCKCDHCVWVISLIKLC